MTLRWGVAGTGRIARTVGGLAAAQPGMTVTAVGSRELGRAAALAVELGATAAYGSYAELLTSPDVDAVYVATPHAQHADVVEPALRAGLAVLCEKPLTASLRETQRLVDVARETGGFLMEAQWMRFNPLVQQLQALLRAGGLGEVRSLTTAFGLVAPDDPTSRLWDPALGGGALLDLGVYTVDLARLLLGDPSSIAVRGTLGPTGVDAESTLTLAYPSGATAVLTQTLLAAPPRDALVVGGRGWAQLSPSLHAPTLLRLQVDGDGPVEHVIPSREAGFAGELQEVARCVREGRRESTVMPLSETVATMTVLEEARRVLSAR